MSATMPRRKKVGYCRRGPTASGPEALRKLGGNFEVSPRCPGLLILFRKADASVSRTLIRQMHFDQICNCSENFNMLSHLPGLTSMAIRGVCCNRMQSSWFSGYPSRISLNTGNDSCAQPGLVPVLSIDHLALIISMRMVE